MTDLRHIGQLLHAAAVTEGLGSTALAAWLRTPHQRGRRGRRQRGPEPAARVRRRSGSGAHDPPEQRPGVPDRLLPRSCGTAGRSTIDVPVFHDPDNGNRAHHRRRRTDEHRLPTATSSCERGEQRGEDLRLLYVALTRAQHQAVSGGPARRTAENSPLGPPPVRPGPDGEIVPRAGSVRTRRRRSSSGLRRPRAARSRSSRSQTAVDSGGSAPSRAPPELRRHRLRPRRSTRAGDAPRTRHHQRSHEQPTIASEPEAGG